MSLFSMLAGLFSGTSARNVCIVDGDRMAGGDRVGPGERFQALIRLARFATREELNVKVVFGGRPLREAADGDNYNGVEVFYAENIEGVTKRIGKLLSSAGSRGVLVTSDQALEEEMSGRGYATMRIGTLRKAMETSSGENGGSREGGERYGGRDRDGGRRHRHRGGRGGHRRHEHPQGESRQPAAPNQASQENQGGNRAPEAPAGQGGSPAADSSVKNLIDLVE